MSFCKISNPLRTFFSNSRIISRSNTRFLQAAQLKLLQQHTSFHSSPQCSSTSNSTRHEVVASYCAAHSTPQPAYLQKIYDETIKNREESLMMVSHLQGSFLTSFCKMMNAEKVLELGCFTGYSALCFAEGVKGNGKNAKVVSCEKDPEYAKIALQNVKEAGMNDLVEIKVGDAKETLQKFDGSTRFDIIFIDADKPGYIHYYDTVLERNLLSEKGVIIADNALFQGYVEKFPDFDSTREMREFEGSNITIARFHVLARHLHGFNEYVTKDPRTTNLLVPAFDGLMLIRKN